MKYNNFLSLAVLLFICLGAAVSAHGGGLKTLADKTVRCSWAGTYHHNTKMMVMYLSTFFDRNLKEKLAVLELVDIVSDAT